MTQQVGIDLDLNAQGWQQSAGLALQQASALDSGLARLAATAAVTQRALSQGGPSRSVIAAYGGFAAAAAQAERDLSGLSATQAVTGQRADQLGKGIRSLARDFPISQRAAQDTVQTFTQLGLSMRGQEKQVISLSKTMTQLQGANGGAAPQYAASMTQLERTFGDRGLDPKRVSDTADALTTVSKLGGAPAQGVLDFANAIGPMAQAAGIGKTATLGISTAFTRIGQDGTAAGTAVNRMLADMSKAVRDGGPQMHTYANIVGTTADQFERLFKSNPAEAVTQVTEAIGKNPQQGPRILENLGLDGVRTRQALQALSASGGLRAQIGTALGGYGSGSTQRASDAAFKGFLDQMQRASNAGGQLAQAIGEPLLRPLGVLAAGLAKVAGGVAGAAGSRVGQDVLTTAAVGGVGVLAARRLFGFGMGARVAQQALTSGPVGSFVAGRRLAMGAEVARDEAGNITNIGRTGVMGQTAGYMGRAYEEDRLGAGMMGPVNTRMFGFGMGMGQARMDRQANVQANRADVANGLRNIYGEDSPRYQNYVAATGRGFRDRASRVAGTFLSGYAATNMATLESGGTPDPTAREGVVTGRMSIFGGKVGGFARNVAATGRGVLGGEEGISDASKRLRNDFGDMSRSIQASNREFPSFTRGLMAVGRSTMAGAGAGLNAAGGIAAAGIRGVGGGLLSAMGGPAGLAITGGMLLGTYAYQQHQKSQQEKQDEVDRQNAMTPTDQIDKYNESIGRATAGTSSFADSIQASTRQISTSVTDMATAMSIRPEDVQAAQQNTRVVQQYPSGSTPAQLAAQVRQMSPVGMDPAQLNAIKVDLLRQFPQSTVAATMAQLGPQINQGQPSGPQGDTQPASLSGAPDLRTMVNQASRIETNVKWGEDQSRISSRQMDAGFTSPMNATPGGRYHIKPTQQQLMDTANQSIGQRASSQVQMFGGGFAQQTKLQDINAAMQQAADDGNEPVVRALGQQLAREQLGIQSPPTITSEDIKKNGGFVQALAAKNKQFGGQFATMTSPLGQGGQGISLTPGQGLAPTLQRSQMANTLAPFSLIGPSFDNTLAKPPGTGVYALGQGPAANIRYQSQQSMQASMLQPDDLQKASTAVKDLVDATQKAGGSLGDLAGQSQKAATAINDSSSPAFQRIMQTQQEAQFRNQAASPFRTSGQNIMADMSMNAKIINAGPGDTPETQQSYNQARQGMASDVGQLADQLKARIAAERQYQIQSARMTQDYNRQVARANDDFQRQQQFAAEDFYKQQRYAQQDYETQRVRSTRDFNRQEQRAQQDYTTQVMRAYDDFYTQEKRQERDFEISMQRGQDDYLTQRSRSIRDFNIQMGRQIEDQAEKLYDPYKRIQTQAVWDGRQLMMNLQEQNQSIQRQQQQLQQVRRMGLSNETIQSLGLNDPQNAQQLNKLVDDFLADPTLAKQLNATAAQRLSLGKLLVTDPSNKDIKRAQDDFNRSLSDMEADYNKQVTRARQDMAKAIADQEADFGKSLSRMTADYEKNQRRASQDFATAMSDAASDFNRAMQRQEDAYQTSVTRSLELFHTQMDRMRQDYRTALGRMRDDVDESEKEITGNLDQLWDTVNKLMRNKSADTNKVMKDGLQDTINFVKDPNNAKQVNDAYKNLFPYDLSKVFGTGGPAGGGPDANHQPTAAQWAGSGVQGVGGPDAAHPQGGPYRTVATGDPFAGARTGGMGILQKPATVTQGYGERRQGDPDTGGGWPVAGAVVSQPFGAHNGHDGPGGHPGIDLAVPRGTPIHAPLPGIVVFAGWNDGYGNCVIMDNGGGRSTLYGHQQSIAAHVGEHLKAGGLIGWVDSTGNSTGDHLHFETRVNGQLRNPAQMLPIWEASMGLGTFDPGATAAAYGVGAPVTLDIKDFTGPDHWYGPWGALVQYEKIAEAAAAMDAGNTSVGAMLSGPQVGPLQNYARMLLKKYGWSDQWNDFQALEMSEAGWNVHADNPSSHAYGLAQALPASKYASAGPDWRTNGYTQLDWMMNYIATGNHGAMPFRDPRSAWAFHRAHNYYGDGSIFDGAQTIGVGERGPEAVIPLDGRGISTLAAAFSQAIRPDELRSMFVAGMGQPVAYSTTVHSEDHSTNITADRLEVHAEDPNDMAAQLADKTRRSRLVKSSGGSRT